MTGSADAKPQRCEHGQTVPHVDDDFLTGAHVECPGPVGGGDEAAPEDAPQEWIKVAAVPLAVIKSQGMWAELNAGEQAVVMRAAARLERLQRAVAAVQELIREARARHEAHDIAPFVFVDELVAAVGGTT